MFGRIEACGMCGRIRDDNRGGRCFRCWLLFGDPDVVNVDEHQADEQLTLDVDGSTIRARTSDAT